MFRFGRASNALGAVWREGRWRHGTQREAEGRSESALCLDWLAAAPRCWSALRGPGSALKVESPLGEAREITSAGWVAVRLPCPERTRALPHRPRAGLEVGGWDGGSGAAVDGERARWRGSYFFGPGSAVLLRVRLSRYSLMSRSR
jgi:hypothetical protein